MRIATRYIPHTVFAIAVTTISIHLVNKRTTYSDEEASVKARISILENIAAQLRLNSQSPASNETLERLKRLASRPLVKDKTPIAGKEEGMISWKDVVFGRKRSAGDELSHWEKKDLEKGRVAITSSRNVLLIFFVSSSRGRKIMIIPRSVLRMVVTRMLRRKSHVERKLN